MFCWCIPFLSVLFVFHGKNVFLLNLISRYMTSTSDKVGGVFRKYGVRNAMVNGLYFLAQKSKSAKIPVKGDLIMFSSHCTFKYKTLSFCHKMSWVQLVEDWISNWPPKFVNFADWWNYLPQIYERLSCTDLSLPSTWVCPLSLFDYRAYPWSWICIA